MKFIKKFKSQLIALLFFAPFIIHVAIFTLYPAINTVILSFKEDYNLLSNQYSGIGFDNYSELFKDKYFIQSISNTFLYALIVVPITLVISVTIADFLNQKLKLSSFFQASFFLPLVTASTAVAYSFRLIFNSQYGILNSILKLFGASPIPWLTSSKYSLFVLCVCGIWNLLPFSILTILSTLQGINQSYYISAKIDGASKFKIFTRITLPAISKSIILLGILHTISSFRVFDELFPLFSGKPGPSYNMYTIVYYMYEQMQSLSLGSYGKAAASSIVLFLILLGLSIVLYLLRSSQRAVRSGRSMQ